MKDLSSELGCLPCFCNDAIFVICCVDVRAWALRDDAMWTNAVQCHVSQPGKVPQGHDTKTFGQPKGQCSTLRAAKQHDGAALALELPQ